MMRHTHLDWLTAGASPERDRRWCFMPGSTLADDLEEFGYTGGGPAVMDDPEAQPSQWPEDSGDSTTQTEDGHADATREATEGIDYETRWKDTNKARLEAKARADRLEAELAQLRARTAQQEAAPAKGQPHPHEDALRQIRAEFTNQLLSLKGDDPAGREKYAEAVANLTDKLTEVKLQATEETRQLQARAQTEWERNSRAALKEAGLPVTEQALQRFTEKVLGLNHTQPGWDKTMSPQDTYRHVAKLVRDEGGIMTEERRSDIERANAEHERGAQRVLGYGSRAVPPTRPDAKKPKTIPEKTFVKQLEEAHEARKQRAKRVYEDARR